MVKIKIEYNEKDIRQLILNDLQEKMSGKDFQEKDLSIKVMSSQNYREKEWEIGRFKCEVETY